MGALLGLTFGVGLVLIAQSVTGAPSWGGHRPRRHRSNNLAELISAAGLEAVTPRQVAATSAGLSLVVGLGFFGLSRTWPIALVFGAFAGYVPVLLIRVRARKRRAELRDLWPDAVDSLASAVRAGLALPEALAQLGTRGPAPLREPFVRFGEDYRATGRFEDSLARLRHRLGDPTGDRVCESLRIARDVGGTDLGRLLRTLSEFLRDDVRTRSELEARQSWVINAARLAVAAPWAMLALLSLRTESIQAFNNPSGVLVLAIGGGICAVAYQLMARLGRLPSEQRVLR